MYLACLLFVNLILRSMWYPRRGRFGCVLSRQRACCHRASGIQHLLHCIHASPARLLVLCPGPSSCVQRHLSNFTLPLVMLLPQVPHRWLDGDASPHSSAQAAAGSPAGRAVPAAAAAAAGGEHLHRRGALLWKGQRNRGVTCVGLVLACLVGRFIVVVHSGCWKMLIILHKQHQYLAH